MIDISAPAATGVFQFLCQPTYFDDVGYMEIIRSFSYVIGSTIVAIRKDGTPCTRLKGRVWIILSAAITSIEGMSTRKLVTYFMLKCGKKVVFIITAARYPPCFIVVVTGATPDDTTYIRACFGKYLS